MSVYRPKGSRFYHYDFIVEGRRFYGSTGQTGKTDAKRVEAAKRRELANGTKKVELTLDEACGTYFVHVAERQPFARTTRSQIKNLLAGIGRTVLLSGIDFKTLSDYALKRRAKVSDSTVNRDLQCLRRVLKWCGKAQGAALPCWCPHANMAQGRFLGPEDHGSGQGRQVAGCAADNLHAGSDS